MMVARTPNGVAVQFNTANHAAWIAGHPRIDLTTKKGGYWVASIPNTWSIELVHPCKVSAPEAALTPEACVRFLSENPELLRMVSNRRLGTIKKELEKYNRQRGTWK